MVSEQDEEDSKLQWRVEQEVGAALSAREAAEARERATGIRLEAAQKKVMTTRQRVSGHCRNGWLHK